MNLSSISTIYRYICNICREEKANETKIKTNTKIIEDWTTFKESFTLWKIGKDVSTKQLKRNFSPLQFFLLSYYSFKKQSNVKTGFEEYFTYQNQFLKENSIDVSIISRSQSQYMFENYEIDISPVSAIVGGVVAQDIIRLVICLQSHTDTL